MRMLYSIPPSYRAARSAGIGELDSSIVKDFIDSEDPKHTLFCCEIAFVAKIYKYALIDKFQGSLDSAASCAALPSYILKAKKYAEKVRKSRQKISRKSA